VVVAVARIKLDDDAIVFGLPARAQVGIFVEDLSGHG
jgi:hypothetical protein